MKPNRKNDTEEKIFESLEESKESPEIKKLKGKDTKTAKELTLTSMNESASKKKRPFEMGEQEDEEGLKPFSLKNLDAEQMK